MIVVISAITLVVPKIVGKDLVKKRKIQSVCVENYMVILKDLLFNKRIFIKNTMSIIISLCIY